MAKGPTPQQLDTKAVIASAYMFTVRRFEGVGKYLMADVPTLIEAAAIARLWGKGPYGHGPLVYAVNAAGRCVHVEEREFPKMVDEEKRYYVCDYRDLGNVRINDFATLDEATANCPSEGGASVISEENQIKDLSSDAQVAIYNHLRRSGKPITAFANADEAAARVFTLLCAPRDRAIGEVTAEQPERTQEGTDMATKTKKAKAKKAKTPKPAKAPKAAKTAKTAKAKAPKAAANGHDAFGLRKNSKSSEAARMMARTNGASMAEVKEAVGDTKYNLVKKLKAAGHKVKVEEGRYYLTAK